MKIVFCITGGPNRNDFKNGNLLGIQAVVFSLSKELVKRGYDTYIIRRWHCDNIEEEVIEGVNVVNIKMPINRNVSYFSLFGLSYYLNKKIKKIQPDVIILTEIVSSLIISKLKIPKIYVAHNTPSSLCYNSSTNRNIIKKPIEKFVFKNCDMLIGLNSKTNEYFLKNGYDSKYIPNGVDAKKYNINISDKSFIFYGGRFEKIKGVDVLIKAYSKLDYKLKAKYKLILVGSGSEEAKLRDMVEDFGINNDV